ncbi:Gibberellin-regulated protein 11 [Ananas comosus]|nr:Gibberellin-regulated protein 11 [Ananas comosus]
MATTQLILLTLLLAFSFTLHHLAVEAHEEVEHQLASKGARTLLATMDCNSACSGRCQLSSRLNYCMRACKTCCARCSCVPPGTSGNYDQCPCYASLTTRSSKKKCP